MDLFLENLKQIFKIDSNTAATIVITIFVFVAGIIINLIVKWIGEFLRRNRTKKLLRIIIEELYFTYPWYGEGARGNGSCIPVYQYTSGGKKAEIFPFSLYAYSGGTVEIGFQHLIKRTPFDKPELRLEFLKKLNAIPGVNISEDRINLRPSFLLSVLKDHQAFQRFTEAVEWVLGVCRGEE